MMRLKIKKYFIITLVFSFILIGLLLIFNENLNTQTSDETEFKLFLNLVIQNSTKAKESGYSFIKKYPNSSFVADVLYYLSFIEQDYFQNIINLKKVVLYYPYSLWRESSLIKILSIYLLHGNFLQIDQWYLYYLDNFSIKNRRWEVEIIYLKSLYQQKKYDLLSEKIDGHLKDANNYQLLSYCILLKAILLKEKNLVLAKKYFLCGITMFSESNHYESFIYELYKIGNRDEKPFYANILINKRIFITLNENEKDEINKYASLKTSFIPDKVIIKEYIRNYYYILLGYSSDMQKIKEIQESFKKIGIEVFYKSINESIYQIYIGYYHFKSDAQDTLHKISKAGFSGQLNFVDYSY